MKTSSVTNSTNSDYSSRPEQEGEPQRNTPEQPADFERESAQPEQQFDEDKEQLFYAAATSTTEGTDEVIAIATEEPPPSPSPATAAAVLSEQQQEHQQDSRSLIVYSSKRQITPTPSVDDYQEQISTNKTVIAAADSESENHDPNAHHCRTQEQQQHSIIYIDDLSVNQVSSGEVVLKDPTTYSTATSNIRYTSKSSKNKYQLQQQQQLQQQLTLQKSSSAKRKRETTTGK